MTVGELITELEKLPKDLRVLVAGEEAEKVIIESCGDNSYVRIFEPWDVEFVDGYIGE
jgi:hypothetical protein